MGRTPVNMHLSTHTCTHTSLVLLPQRWKVPQLRVSSDSQRTKWGRWAVKTWGQRRERKPQGRNRTTMSWLCSSAKEVSMRDRARLPCLNVSLPLISHGTLIWFNVCPPISMVTCVPLPFAWLHVCPSPLHGYICAPPLSMVTRCTQCHPP